MRRLAWRALALTVTAALLAAVIPFTAVPALAAGADRTIGRMTTPPTVDGVIGPGEWGTRYMELHNYQTSTVAGDAYKVPLSGKVRFGYDATHFYLAVEAVYDEHENNYTGFDLWRGDALQIQISAGGRGDRRAFCFGIGSDGKVRGYQSGRETYEPTAAGGEFYVRRDEAAKTTVYEVALPLSRFSNSVTSFKQGDQLAFSYAMHMHNGYYYEWCGGIVKEKNINLAATLTLGDEAELNAVGETLPMGDVDRDGTVTTTDARLVLQRSVEKIDDNSLDMRVADVDGDGAVTSTDARMILQKSVGKLQEFWAGNTLTLPGEERSSRYVSSNSYSPLSSRAGRRFKNLDEVEKIPVDLTSDTYEFSFFALTTDANETLPFNLACRVGSSTITGMVPAGVDLSHVIPTFAYYGGSVKAEGKPLVSDVTALDLTHDVTLTLSSMSGSTRTMTVHLEQLDTGLPSVALTVENYETITSKEEYRNVTLYVGGGDAESARLLAGQAKGRGNTSWGEPKKGYNVKLEKKATLLGMSESKDWTLIANYEDETLLRNIMAQYLAEGAGMEYVMKNRPVDLWYNGEYWGTYNLIEKIEVEKDRVNITKYEAGAAYGATGYLMEFDSHVNEKDQSVKDRWLRPLGNGYELYYNADTDEMFMPISIGGKWLTIKKPSYKNLNEAQDFIQLKYIYDKVHDAIDAVRSRDWNRIDQIIDVRSWCKWYLVEEYMNNTDSSFHSSCYMTLDVGGKFKLGPVWDFDRSSNNCDYWNTNEDINSLYTSGAAWFYLIFDTQEGRAILKEEYTRFRRCLDGLPDYLEQMADTIYASQIYNFQKWDMLDRPGVNANRGNPVGEAMWSSQTFEAEVARLESYFFRTTQKMDGFIPYI